MIQVLSQSLEHKSVKMVAVLSCTNYNWKCSLHSKHFPDGNSVFQAAAFLLFVFRLRISPRIRAGWRQKWAQPKLSEEFSYHFPPWFYSLFSAKISPDFLMEIKNFLTFFEIPLRNLTIYHKLFIVCCDARVKSPEIRCRLACRKIFESGICQKQECFWVY